ncbi:MAG: class I SAM-dependent methyltransferase [Chloroflexi bacterium]|nr:class I SAM-dependent methyltransferase [Chloroflexota bacterium]
MPINWMDMTNVSFNTLLLLERVQLSWFPGWVDPNDLGLALKANPVVEWYLRHKCPEIYEWLDGIMSQVGDSLPEALLLRQAEVRILQSITDLVTYVLDPAFYDAQEFLNWDPKELTSLVDFSARIVIDVGSGTGRLAFIAAQTAKTVFAVEPVGNLRYYLQSKAIQSGVMNIYPMDGLITNLPFPPGFADVTMGGHVFGDAPGKEMAEMVRVTKPGGSIILCPGNDESDNERHAFLTSQGFSWKSFIEPPDDRVRKYWKVI